MINLGNKRELFFDDHLLNSEKTTAKKQLHKLRRTNEVLINFEAPWEGNTCGYHSVFFAEGKWRMYYRASQWRRSGRFVAYAESTDALHWTKPSLGIVEFNGSKDNNILLNYEIIIQTVMKHLNNMILEKCRF